MSREIHKRFGIVCCILIGFGIPEIVSFLVESHYPAWKQVLISLVLSVVSACGLSYAVKYYYPETHGNPETHESESTPPRKRWLKRPPSRAEKCILFAFIIFSPQWMLALNWTMNRLLFVPLIVAFYILLSWTIVTAIRWQNKT